MSLLNSCISGAASRPESSRLIAASSEGSLGGDTRIVGQSIGIQRAIVLARKLARTDLPILLVAATGSGKELFAEEIHRWSGRTGPFVDVNSAALPREMIEALLFGHRRGSFTGAFEHSAGLLEEANGGTLFLDELVSMPVEAQAKLLRVLETGEIRRVGETTKRRVRFRTIGALQDGPSNRSSVGRLRTDLLQRLAGAVIEIPSLAERAEDLELLAGHFAAVKECSLGPGAAAVLRGHDWPGNVRELRLAVERACLLSDEPVVSARGLAESISLGAALLRIGGAEIRAAEPIMTPSTRDRLLAAFAAHDWNAARTARALGLGRTTLFKQLKAMGISLREERSSLAGRTLTTERWFARRCMESD